MMLFYEGDLDENLVFEFEDLNIFLLSMSFLNLMLVMHHGDAGGTDGDCAGDDTHFLCSYLALLIIED